MNSDGNISLFQLQSNIYKTGILLLHTTLVLQMFRRNLNSDIMSVVGSQFKVKELSRF